MMSGGVGVTYPVHDVLLGFGVEVRQIIIYNGHSFVELLLPKYEEGDGGMEEVKSWSCSQCR